MEGLVSNQEASLRLMQKAEAIIRSVPLEIHMDTGEKTAENVILVWLNQ